MQAFSVMNMDQDCGTIDNEEQTKLLIRLMYASVTDLLAIAICLS